MFCIVALSHTSAVSFSDSNCRLLFSPVNSQPKGLMERSSRPLHLFCQTRSVGIAGTAASMKAGVLQARIHSQYPARKIFMALTATRQTVKKVEGGKQAVPLLQPPSIRDRCMKDHRLKPVGLAQARNKLKNDQENDSHRLESFYSPS